jgi:ubiquinone/menaquinone biosynthesis C-methylase UbiE
MDKNYWEEYYRARNAELKPSLFARYVFEQYCTSDTELIELGCGNGRDSVFFANGGLNVTAVDECESEIKFLNARYKHLENCTFLSADFSAMNDVEKTFDIVYSRFTLHSVSKEQERNTLS